MGVGFWGLGGLDLELEFRAEDLQIWPWIFGVWIFGVRGPRGCGRIFEPIWGLHTSRLGVQAWP